MDQSNFLQPVIEKPLFQTPSLNIDYVFSKIYFFIIFLFNFLVNPHTWFVVGAISSFISLLCIAIIIFSLVRLFEIQSEEKRELYHEIHEALKRKKQEGRSENPRWHYVLTLSESPNSSDWRVAVLEADNILEEILRSKGYNGETTSELLESAKESGYSAIHNVWEAHLVRNQIAHAGSDFPFSQIEARRIIRVYQNFFEELKAI